MFRSILDFYKVEYLGKDLKSCNITSKLEGGYCCQRELYMAKNLKIIVFCELNLVVPQPLIGNTRILCIPPLITD